MITIPDEDIKYAERILLPEGASFDTERVNVIKCMESKDIQACPGSGKTTVLLAKLAIIAQKMPLEENKGICVLTHTNVAINEIKDKLGLKGKILFEYPNFIGTIQSFVDRFLATQANLYYYGTRPLKIDAALHDFEICNKCNRLSRHSALNGWLYQSVKNRTISKSDFLKEIRFDFVTKKFTHGLNGKVLLKNEKADSYRELFALKEDLFKNGILHYDDAYSLAFRYLNDFNQMLREMFCNRFAFVFIDEMQDTDFHQNQLINLIFNDTNVIMQKFGDSNQSIYEYTVKDETIWDVNEGCLCINGSKRFSESIALCVKHFSINPQEITGNRSVENIFPIVLIYNDQTIEHVIPCFSKIIKEKNIILKDTPFKAVGWVGQIKDGERTLPSYFTSYQKKVIDRPNYDSLREYLNKVDDEQINIRGAECYRNSIIEALIRILRAYNIKNEKSHHFTVNSFLKFLKEKDHDVYEKFNLKLAEWCLQIHNGTDIGDDLQSFIENEFSTFFEINDLSNLKSFLEIKNDIEHIEYSKGKQNVYTDNSDIEIEVATVHSVKGETHSATLYLETYYNKGYDVQRVLNYLHNSSQSPNTIESTSLKMCYVGMTRPTHLLCVAAHQNSIGKKEEYLKRNGWEIRDLTKDVQPC